MERDKILLELVKSYGKNYPVGKILLTTDLSEESKEAFPVARRYAEALGSEILLAAIIEDPAQAALVYAMENPVLPNIEIQSQLAERVEKDLSGFIENMPQSTKVTPLVHTAKGSVDTEIVKLAIENQVELIVMSTHGRTGISHLLLGSVTERVIKNAPCPVMVVPATKE